MKVLLPIIIPTFNGVPFVPAQLEAIFYVLTAATGELNEDAVVELVDKIRTELTRDAQDEQRCFNYTSQEGMVFPGLSLRIVEAASGCFVLYITDSENRGLESTTADALRVERMLDSIQVSTLLPTVAGEFTFDFEWIMRTVRRIYMTPRTESDLPELSGLFVANWLMEQVRSSTFDASAPMMTLVHPVLPDWDVTVEFQGCDFAATNQRGNPACRLNGSVIWGPVSSVPEGAEPVQPLLILNIKYGGAVGGWLSDARWLQKLLRDVAAGLVSSLKN